MSKRMLLLILLGLSINMAQAQPAQAESQSQNGDKAQTESTADGASNSDSAQAATDDDGKAESTKSSDDADAETESTQTPAADTETSSADETGAEPAAAPDSGDTQADAAKTLVNGDAAAGAKLSPTCAACHGADGNSTNPVWPKLAGQGAPYIFEQLMEFKSGKRKNPIMAGQVTNLSEQDMRDVAAYFSQQQTKPGVADESLVEQGGAIYHGGIPEEKVPACSGCHGPSGLGQPPAKFPRLSGQHAAYVSAQLTAYRDGERSGSRNGKIMADVAAKLSDADIQALSSYVEGLGPQAAK